LTHIRIFVEEYPMSLYIRDPDVAALAAKLQDLTGSRTKTEAVRLALQQAIERANAKRSFARLSRPTLLHGGCEARVGAGERSITRHGRRWLARDRAYD
jgi:hypothetical protein